MINAVYNTEMTVLENLNLKHKSKQAGTTFTRAALHQKSHALVLSPQFGRSLSIKSAEAETLPDARVLPKMKIRKDFEGTNRFNSSKKNILNQVKNKKDVLMGKTKKWRIMGVVTRTVMNNSASFLLELFDFPTNEVEMVNRDKGVETEGANWLYVSRFIC